MLGIGISSALHLQGSKWPEAFAPGERSKSRCRLKVLVGAILRLSGLQYVLSTQDAELPPKRRLGDTYLTDPVQHIDPQKKKIWFAGGPDIDKVFLVCLEASAYHKHAMCRCISIQHWP